jgi:hypothetical protein
VSCNEGPAPSERIAKLLGRLLSCPPMSLMPALELDRFIDRVLSSERSRLDPGDALTIEAAEELDAAYAGDHARALEQWVGMFGDQWEPLGGAAPLRCRSQPAARPQAPRALSRRGARMSCDRRVL